MQGVFDVEYKAIIVFACVEQPACKTNREVGWCLLFCLSKYSFLYYYLGTWTEGRLPRPAVARSAN